jgi:HD superfamily phosphohydrolase YqeK
MLPARGTATLDSPVFNVLEQAVDEVPESMTEVLLAALEYEFDDHKAFVWRLLHDAMRIKPNPKVLAKAEEMTSAQLSPPPTLLTEIERTISAFVRQG